MDCCLWGAGQKIPETVLSSEKERQAAVGQARHRRLDAAYLADSPFEFPGELASVATFEELTALTSWTNGL